MSFLTLLFFTLLVYIAAADPVEKSESLLNHQEKLDAFMKAVDQAYQDNMEPMFASLPEQQRVSMRAMAMNGFSGYANHCMMQLHNSTNAKDDDIVLQFTCKDSFKYPTVSHSPLEECKN